MKKEFKRIIGLVIFTVTCLGLFLTSAAMETGFKTEALPEKEQRSFVEGLDLKLINEEPKKTAFRYYGVSETGKLAISANTKKEGFLSVYDRDGKFLYGYSFTDPNYAVTWDKENILLYFYDRERLVSVDRNGKLLEVVFAGKSEENLDYGIKYVYNPDKTVGDYEYHLKNHLGIFESFFPYCQLVRVDAEGKEEVLYDLSSSFFGLAVLKVLCFIGILAAVILLIIFIFRTALKKGRKFKEINVAEATPPQGSDASSSGAVTQATAKPPKRIFTENEIAFRRLAAGIIDFIIIAILSSLIPLAIAGRNFSENRLAAGIFLGLLALLHVVKDYCFKNASIGKKLLKLKIVDKSGKGKVTFGARLLRAVSLLISPIEILLIILQNVRLGDLWSKAGVVQE